jgi:hypothetical protein
MKINKNVYRWLAHNNNLFIKGISSFCFPGILIRSIYNHNLGRRWNGKKTCLTLSFDCDHPEDVTAFPDLLNILKKYDLKASFACVGYWIEKYADEHQSLLGHGHEIINHTYSHPDNEILNPDRRFTHISFEEKKEEVAKCHDICRKILRYEPIGCRIPHFNRLFTPEIYKILKELGYRYSSSTSLTNTISFGNPFIAKDGVIEFPLSTCPKHPFTVFDTWHSLNSNRLLLKLLHSTEGQYLELFKFLLDLGRETNSYINIYIDTKDVIKMPRFEQVLDYINNHKEDIWVAKYEELIRMVEV